MRTDVEGERAVGKITRTAAGGAASLTIVWQEFRFQLCTALLCSSSPPLRCPLLCLPTSAWMLSNQVFFTIFPLSWICAFLSPSPSFISPLCHLPKPQHTLKAGLQSVSEGQVWCDSKWEGGGWEERGSCLSWPWSMNPPQHNSMMKERGERVGVKQCGELRLYYHDVNTNTGPTDVVTWHRDKRSLFSCTSVYVSLWTQTRVSSQPIGGCSFDENFSQRSWEQRSKTFKFWVYLRLYSFCAFGEILYFQLYTWFPPKNVSDLSRSLKQLETFSDRARGEF